MNRFHLGSFAEVSNLEKCANKLLADNPSDIVVLTESQLHRIARSEVLIDPQHISEANDYLKKEIRVDALRIRDRERKRLANAIAGNPVVRKGKIKTVQ